jgi:competence protein ComEC
MALWGGREIAGLILASLVAGLVTTPYAAYHFHRAAPYGALANLLAMPVVSAEVMPMGILGVLAMPFGFDAVFWQLMGAGLDWMTAVALWVTRLPGAVGHVRARDWTTAARHGRDIAAVLVAHAAALERGRAHGASL